MDGEGVDVMSGKGKKSRVISHRDIRRRGVEVRIDIILVARKGGKNKILGPERDAATGAGGGKNAGGGGRSSRGSIIIFFVVTLAGRELQRQVDNSGENDQADDANGRALCVDGNRRERSGGEDDDGNDDSCLSDWLGFNFKANFMS